MLLLRVGVVGAGASSSSISAGGQLCPGTPDFPCPCSKDSQYPPPAWSRGQRSTLGRGQLWQGAAGSLLLPVYRWGSGSAAARGVRGRCVQEMKACQCPGVKLFSRRWAASFQVLVQAQGCVTLPETSPPALGALWKLCFIFTVWLGHLEASSLQTTALGHQAFSRFPQSFVRCD